MSNHDIALDEHLASASMLLLGMPASDRYAKLNWLVLSMLRAGNPGHAGLFLADLAIMRDCGPAVMREILRDVHPDGRAECLIDLIKSMSDSEEIAAALAAELREFLR